MGVETSLTIVFCTGVTAFVIVSILALYGAPPATSVAGRVVGVPDRAYQTLIEIDAGRWPSSADAPGTKGGDQWMNRGGSLPTSDSSGKAITYREWDADPKKPGQARDAQRIITGSDGSAYYTGDRYKSFIRMR